MKTLQELVEHLEDVIANCSGPPMEPEGLTVMPTDLAQEILERLRGELSNMRRMPTLPSYESLMGRLEFDR